MFDHAVVASQVARARRNCIPYEYKSVGHDPRLPMPVIGLNNDGYINNEYCHMALIPTTKENNK